MTISVCPNSSARPPILADRPCRELDHPGLGEFRPALLGFALLLIAVSPGGAAIIRPIAAPGGSVVLVRFHSGGHADPRGAGIGVFDARNQPVKHRLLAHDPAGETVLAVDLRDASGQVEMHYGQRAIEGAVSVEEIPISLVLRTYAMGGAVRDVKQLVGAIDSATPLGTALIERISFAHNPFGADDRFVTDVQGLLRVDQDTNVRFFSSHDDAGFVFIDGSLVTGGAAPNDVRRSEQLAGQAVEVLLSRGEHRLRYVHVQRGGPTRALLGHIRGQRAVPVPASMFVHHRLAKLGPARTDDEGVPAGFDARQVDQMTHGGFVYTRFRLAPIAPLAGAGGRCRFSFAGQAVRVVKEATPFDQVLVVPFDRLRKVRWRVDMTVLDAEGQAVGQASGSVGCTVFGGFATIGDESRLQAFAKAIGMSRYGGVGADVLEALYLLVQQAERPALAAPVADAYLQRFAKSGGPLVADMSYTLATHLARDDPRRAADLFADAARIPGDVWKSTCAAAEHLDLLIFRLGQTKDLDAVIRRYYPGRSPREIALLKARLGDVHRLAGRRDKAEEAYRDAQRVASGHMDRRQAAVLQSAYRETALSYLQQGRYPALRDILFQWEADFPTAKLGADVPLLVGRYCQAVGDDARAAVEFETILKLNPLHPSLPEISFRLGESLARLGRSDDARQYFERVARDYPNSPFAEKVLK